MNQLGSSKPLLLSPYLLPPKKILPDSIGFSPLTPGHPKGLYHNRYQASTPLSRSFTLPRARSSGFGSLSRDCPHFHTMRLVTYAHIAFAAASRKAVSLATRKNSLPRFSKRTTGWSLLREL